MIHTTSMANSEVAIMQEIYKLADAGASVIQVRTREPVRTSLVLRKSILASEDSEYKEWDIVNGFRTFTMENYTNNLVPGVAGTDDFVTALQTPLNELRNPSSTLRANSKKIHFYVFVDPHPFLQQNPYVIELVQQYAAILPSTNVCILFVTPDVSLDDIPAGTLLLADMSTPSAEELQEVLIRIVEDGASDFEGGHTLDEDDFQRISYLGLGLSLYEFETYAAIAIIDASTAKETELTAEAMAKGIAQGKTAVVKQSEILELQSTDNMENVGGMKKLKDWVASRANCYSEEAREFGIEPPKGAVLVGVPGAGKSLVAKAIGNTLGVPLVRLDFGRVFSKYVGDSESRVRAALRMVESMAPCVLFVDEIDKGLGGIGGGGGDSGTSSRVLGSFLTWLQENKSPVFVMVTANRVDGLPPELLRRGRFDAIFSVTLPNPKERIEVLQIHLRKRNQSFDFSQGDIDSFVKASDRYVPAEIESAVKDALIAAFNAGEDLSMRHINTALQEMVPISTSYAAQIEAMMTWAAKNATPVSDPNEDAAEVIANITGAAGSRRVGRRTR